MHIFTHQSFLSPLTMLMLCPSLFRKYCPSIMFPDYLKAINTLPLMNWESSTFYHYHLSNDPWKSLWRSKDQPLPPLPLWLSYWWDLAPMWDMDMAKELKYLKGGGWQEEGVGFLSSWAFSICHSMIGSQQRNPFAWNKISQHFLYLSQRYRNSLLTCDLCSSMELRGINLHVFHSPRIDKVFQWILFLFFFVDLHNMVHVFLEE